MLAKKPKAKGATQKRGGSSLASLLWMLLGAILTIVIGAFIFFADPFNSDSPTTTERRAVEPINQPESETEDGDFEFYDLLPEQEITSIPDEAMDREPNVDEIFDIEPDVVLTEPDDANNSNSQNNSNNHNSYGISEDNILNPMDNQQPAGTDNGEQDMVIIEEEGTYDGPDEGTGSSSNEGSNSGASSQDSRNQAQGQNTSAASTPRQTYILQINSFSSAQEADKRRAQVLMAGVDAQVVKSKMANGQVVYQVVSPTMRNRQAVISAQQKLQNNGIDSLIIEQRR